MRSCRISGTGTEPHAGYFFGAVAGLAFSQTLAVMRSPAWSFFRTSALSTLQSITMVGIQPSTWHQLAASNEERRIWKLESVRTITRWWVWQSRQVFSIADCATAIPLSFFASTAACMSVAALIPA